MRRLIIFCLAGLLLTVERPVSPAPSTPGAITAAGGSSLLARDQDVLVSRKVVGINGAPDFDVSPKGDVLVAWTSSSATATDSEIWVAVVKRKGSGKFKKKPKPFKLSTEAASHFAPRVAWIGEIQQFFVVWERAGATATDNTRRILARAVDGKTGKPVGGVKTLVSDNRFNTTPVITAAFANGKQDITLFFTSAPNPFARQAARSAGNSSLNSAQVTPELTAEEIVKLMKMPGGTTPEVLQVVDLSKDGQSCRFVLYRTFNQFSTGFAHAKLVVNGKVTDERKIRLFMGATGKAQATADGSRVVVTATSDGSTTPDFTEIVEFAALCNVNGGILSEVGNSGGASPRVSMFALLGQGSQSRVAGIGYLISAQTDGNVYEQVLDKDLKLVGAQESVFDHGNTLTAMIGGDITPDSSNRSARLGKKPNSVLVWTKAVGNAFDQEIRAHFFYLQPTQ